MAKRLVLRSATALMAALSVVAMASAQDRGGSNATLTLSQGFRLVDNARLTAGGGKNALESVTSVGLNYTTATKASSFSAATRVSAIYDTDAGDFDVSEPVLRLGLTRSNRDAHIGATLNFRQSQVSRSDVGEDFESTDLSLSTATLRHTRLGLSGEMGKTARVGLTYGLDYSDRDYSDVSSGEELFDSRSVSARAALRMDLTRTVSTRLAYRLNRSRTDNPDGDDVDSQSLTASVTAAIDKVTSVTAGLNYSISERTSQTGNSRTTDGLGYNLALTRTLRNGALGARVSGRQTSNGLRTSVSVNRSLETKTGKLALSFGAVQTGDLGWDPLMSLNYTHDLKRGALSVQLSQQAVTNSEDDETLRTRFGAKYSQTLTRTSALSAGISVADIRGLSDGAEDSRRSTLDLSYRQALAQDWGLVGGYSLLHSRRSDRDDVVANALFLRVEKQFDWRP